MNTITRIRELDAYLVLFMDWNVIHNYCLLSKETNQIIINHELFKLMKEYHKNRYYYVTERTWAINTDKPLILDWHTNLGIGFNNIFVLIDGAIDNASIKVLNWFYNKGIFDYTLASLHCAIIHGSMDSIDWFYAHGLETSYLDKLLSKPEALTEHIYDCEKLLSVLKWLHRNKYPIKFDIKPCIKQVSHTISTGWIELIKWLLDMQLVVKSDFSEIKVFSYRMKNLPVEKQLEILILLKELGYCFNETQNMPLGRPIEDTLFDYPIEIRKWCLENIPQITIEQIFSFAAMSEDIEAMKWSGIDKNHPNFGLVNHKFILEQAIPNHRMAVIDWYFDNITFTDQILDDLINAFKNAYNSTKLTVEKIMLFKKYFKKYNRHYLSLFPHIIRNAFNEANISVLEYLLPKLPTGISICICAGDIANCISYGYIDSLKWIEKYLHEDGTYKPIKINVVDDNRIFGDNNRTFKMAVDSAAYGGYFETIKWLKQFFPRNFDYSTAVNYAARLYRIDILDWFNNLPDFKYSVDAIDMAVLRCGIQILKWFHSSGHPLKYSNSMIDRSIYHGKIHILQWLKENGYPMVFRPKSIHIACTSSLFNLQWLKDNGVIKILSREMINNLLVFKIELSQPFATSGRYNVIYEMDSWSVIRDDINFHVIVDSGTECVDVQNDGKSNIIELRYKYDVITSMDNITGESQYKIYHSMCWFERWYKQMALTEPT